MPPAGRFAFGAFELDMRTKRLTRAGEPVVLSLRELDLLHALVTRAPHVVSKNDLIDAAWQDTAVTDSSLVKAINLLREQLDAADEERYIQTVTRQGYRFVVPVTEGEERVTDADLDALMAPHRALIEGLAALETLERARIVRARAVFQQLVAREVRSAIFHVGLANACALLFESTRADPAPDTEALRIALAHAREACRLDPGLGEAWATLGFVLERTGARRDALAALRQAVQLDPKNWRHQFRLAYASWGEERLVAARRTLDLWPDFPMACFLIASVFVARDALTLAERELDVALAALPVPSSSSSRTPIVALHYLKGLLCLAAGRDAEGLAALERELQLESRDHLYTRECCASTWYVKGVYLLRKGVIEESRAALAQATARVPGHAMANIAMALLEERDGTASELPGNEVPSPMLVEVALTRAALLVANGEVAAASALVGESLVTAPPGNAGWLLPVDPLLQVQCNKPAWAGTLATLRSRAGVWLTPEDPLD